MPLRQLTVKKIFAKKPLPFKENLGAEQKDMTAYWRATASQVNSAQAELAPYQPDVTAYWRATASLWHQAPQRREDGTQTSRLWRLALDKEDYCNYKEDEAQEWHEGIQDIAWRRKGPWNKASDGKAEHEHSDQLVFSHGNPRYNKGKLVLKPF